MDATVNIFTFYDTVEQIDPEGQKALIQMWIRNWSSQGFKCFVINERHAERHPWYREFKEIVEQFPTVNPGKYEYYCFIRWLSFAQCCGHQKALMSDYDVMSYGFRPTSIEDKRLVLYQGHVPALVLGDRSSVDNLCQMFMDYKVQHDDTYNGRPHISDMHILQKLLTKYSQRFCVDEQVKCYNEEGWGDMAAVHYSHHSMGEMRPRHKFILELRQPFPQ